MLGQAFRYQRCALESLALQRWGITRWVSGTGELSPRQLFLEAEGEGQSRPCAVKRQTASERSGWEVPPQQIVQP